MALSTTIGTQALLQLGVLLGDIAVVVNIAKKFGNWFGVSRNDQDLLELLGEPEALKRKSVVDSPKMTSMYPHLDAIYRGQHIRNEQKMIGKAGVEGYQWLTWFMIVTVAALDTCLPPEKTLELVGDLFQQILENEQDASGMRVLLETNVESWRSAGKVSSASKNVCDHFNKAWRQLKMPEAILELNHAEYDEMKHFLEIFMVGQEDEFLCVSATTYAAAKAIEHAGICMLKTNTADHVAREENLKLGPDDKPPRERELHVKPSSSRGSSQLGVSGSLARRSTVLRSQMVSYPTGKPEAMIETIGVQRRTKNFMEILWKKGAEAGQKLRLRAATNGPFDSNREFSYKLVDDHEVSKRPSFEVNDLVRRVLPCDSQHLLESVEELAAEWEATQWEWINQHTGLEYLDRNPAIGGDQAEYMSLFASTQALVFGFYYALLGQLVHFEHVSPNAFLRGVWGDGGTIFLAMCIKFGKELRSAYGAGRTHVLHMLSTMYGGRQRAYPGSRRNLLAVFGPISVVAWPLFRTTDQPQEIAKFVILDLPIINLMGDEDGELYAGTGSALHFSGPEQETTTVRAHGPTNEWEVYPSMGRVLKNGGPGVVMAAQCGWRLVGWFNPTAAETMFLSTAYLDKMHDQESDYEDHGEVEALEVTDAHWQKATGFYAATGHEVCIATDDMTAAFGRIEAQESGVIIA
ncbi:hypothetical protein F5Y15DRAFT_422785 [Xylariaceae sp. FL0016]|nr:hypothetical protein F5Y15DRAFT_422785 [Xylariaceae sp. FL0016]